jgi:hypothetical protein
MKLKESLIYRSDDAVIFDTEKGKLIELNESANIIVSLLSNGKNIEMGEICSKLRQKYPDSDEKDVVEYISEFIKNLKAMDALR